MDNELEYTQAPPVTLYGQHQHRIATELAGLLERHPEEVPMVNRIRAVIQVQGEQK